MRTAVLIGRTSVTVTLRDIVGVMFAGHAIVM